MTATDCTAGNIDSRSVTGHLGELRAALEQQRSFRIEQLAEFTVTAALPSSASATDDPARDAVGIALRAAAAGALADVEGAIGRLDSGDYGRCKGCGGEIPLERLEILPMAALCMPCARTRERHST